MNFRFCRSFAILLICIFGGISFTACQTGSSSSSSNKTNPKPPTGSISSLSKGDVLSVSLQSIPDAANFELQLDDKGEIRLRYIGTLHAAGLSTSELATLIASTYIEKNIYKTVDVSVSLTDRLIYVGGEVKRPGPVQWTPDMTLTKAITSASGFTLYARETGVLLSRNGKSYVLDTKLAKDRPSEDIQIYPGDSINVPRSAF